MPRSGTSIHHHEAPSGPATHADFSLSGDLAWLRDTLGGTSATTGPRRRYLARPSCDDPQLLIPVHPKAVARASLHRGHDARTWRQRLFGIAGQGLAQVGALSIAGGEMIELESFTLIDQLAHALGEPEIIPALSVGPRRRNRKPVIQLIRPDGKVVGYAKVAWSPFTRELISNEAHWLRTIDGRLPTGLRAPVVLLHETFVYTDRPVEVVVTSPIPTPLRSHRHGPLPLALTTALARCLGSHRQTLSDFGLVSQWRTLLAGTVDLDRILDRHGDTVIEFGLWHGDLTPWNTATSRGPLSSVWDWEFAADGRPVGFDALHLVFEQARRSKGEAAAISAVVTDAPDLLGRIPGGPVTTDVEAVIDLYLCEILARESRLLGEGWEPEHLGPLDRHLLDTIKHRLDAPGPDSAAT